MAKLYFYYSAMNAGKSTTLLQSDYNYRERGMHTLLFTPALDDRYGVGKITSRIGVQANAIIFDRSFDFFQYAQTAQQQRAVHCILVDEAHFLVKAQVKQLADICDQLSIPVLTYGIRSDFRAEPFEGSLYLMTWSDALHEIKTICHCGSKATMNLRVDESGQVVSEGDQVQIGHHYVATCRKHYHEAILTAKADVVPA